MTRASGMVVMLLATVLFGGCEREPVIVVRFDPADQRPATRAVQRDLATAGVVDAATTFDAATVAVAPPAAKAQCKTDGDCVLVSDGCCGCANGGKLKTALKREEAKLIAAQKKSCADTMCTMVVSSDPSCGKRVGCVEGVCAMRDARPDEIRKLAAPPASDVK